MFFHRRRQQGEQQNNIFLPISIGIPSNTTYNSKLRSSSTSIYTYDSGDCDDTTNCDDDNGKKLHLYTPPQLQRRKNPRRHHHHSRFLSFWLPSSSSSSSSWSTRTRSTTTIPDCLFRIGVFSVGMIVLLQFSSMWLLSYMTHLQNRSTIDDRSENNSMWIPFWLQISSSSENGVAWTNNDLQQHHRRRIQSASLLVSSSNQLYEEHITKEHIFPIMIHWDASTNSIRRLIDPYNRNSHIHIHVKRPKQFSLLNLKNQHPDYDKIHRKSVKQQQQQQERSYHKRNHTTLTTTVAVVTVDTKEYEIYEKYRSHLIDKMDVPEMNYYYHHYDDLDFASLNDHHRSSSSQGQQQQEECTNTIEDDPTSCERPTWGYDDKNLKTNCNIIHELLYPSLQDGLMHNTIQPLGHGYYRDTYRIRTTTQHEPIVMKQLQYEHRQNHGFQFGINMEAMIMEITTSSKVTSMIYGHCSTTILVESLQDVTNTIVPYRREYQPIRGRVSDEALQYLEVEQAKKLHSNSSSEPYSFNNLTVYEKLQYARQMSEALVEMHGYVGGVIVHDDIHPDQWLLSSDKSRIVLNDINNAAVLSWSRQCHQYCMFWDSYGGDYRAPEMYQEGGTYTTTEQADIYPMGNLIYSLITGLYPYHNVTSNDEVVIQQLTMNPNLRPYLHPKLRQQTNDRHIKINMNTTESEMEEYIYQRLITIMDQCHQMKPNDRPSIFQVYQYLMNTQAVVDEWINLR